MNVLMLHKATWSALQARRARLPHALLLSGQRGLGKLELARLFAASLLCESPREDGLACGQCLACNWFAQGNHPDFRLLQPDALSDEVSDADEGSKKKASQQITIDQVRGLDDFLSVGTHRGGLRIVIVNPAEAMNRNTANALLKTLEEPLPSTLFLLTTNEPARLLPTIRSRCQSVPVPIPEHPVAIAILQDAGIKEPTRWLALAGGAPGEAVLMAASGGSVWLEQLSTRLGQGKNADPLPLAADLEKAVKEAKGKLTLKQIVEAMQKWTIDLTLAGNGIPIRYFVADQATIAQVAAMIRPEGLIRFYRALNVRRREAEQPLNARLFLEGLFMDYRGLFAS